MIGYSPFIVTSKIFSILDNIVLKTVSCHPIKNFRTRTSFRFHPQSKGFPLMSLTKDDIVKALAKENGYQLNQSVELVETLLELIKSKLSSGEDVLISGFGKFCIKEKRERRGRNPATGEGMMLGPRRVVTFRCSRQLRDRING
jgi:integration host factor subunit alpha